MTGHLTPTRRLCYTGGMDTTTNQTFAVGDRVITDSPRNYLERDDNGNFLMDGTDYVTTPIPVGSPAVVIGRESHGANPWTRWTLRVTLPDGREVVSPGHTNMGRAR